MFFTVYVRLEAKSSQVLEYQKVVRGGKIGRIEKCKPGLGSRASTATKPQI